MVCYWVYHLFELLGVPKHALFVFQDVGWMMCISLLVVSQLDKINVFHYITISCVVISIRYSH